MTTETAPLASSPMRRLRQLNKAPGWGFLLPGMTLFFVFFALPNLLNFFFSFTSWTSYSSTIRFIGFENFVNLAQSGTLWDALRVTLTYALGAAALTNIIGLGLAVLLEPDSRLNRFTRSLFFLPLLLSPLAVGYIFQGILQSDGPLNSFIGALIGRPAEILWLGSTTWSLWVVVGIHVWKWSGLTMLIYIAGLKSVPQDYVEAATLDGAGFFRRLRSVTLPLIGPAITFNVAVGLIGAMNTFEIVQATTAGGPANSTRVLNVFIFQQFGQGFFGEATAISLLLFFAISALGIPLVAYLRGREVQL